MTETGNAARYKRGRGGDFLEEEGEEKGMDGMDGIREKNGLDWFFFFSYLFPFFVLFFFVCMARH